VLAYVSVAVATVWTSPDKPRPVDRAALSSPVDIDGWITAMSFPQRLELTDADMTQTQVLLGRPVHVLDRRDGWARVAVPGQPTPRDPLGYPGWIPDAQLTASAPTAAGNAGGVPVPDAGDLVRTARGFLGLPYVWGGRSGFCVDCSGLTGLVHEVHGITIPRDAGPQALDGGATRVERGALRPGDLIFYASEPDDPSGGSIHHVTLYAGDGAMIEAFNHRTPVRVTPVRDAEYWGAVRYPAPA